MRVRALAAFFLMGAASVASAQEPTPTPTPPPRVDAELDDLSLEQLLQLDLKVVSVSKRVESLNDASAAIYAITNEEGRWTVTLLPVGLYSVFYEKEGFKKASNDSVKEAVVVSGFARPNFVGFVVDATFGTVGMHQALQREEILA